MYPSRPMPTDDATRQRVDHQSLRYRILYGHWREDLRSRIVHEVGTTRAEAWGEPDLGANLLLSASSAVATLYDYEPSVYHDEPTAAARMADLLRDAHWPTLMQRIQRDTIAIREMLIRVDVVGVGRRRRVRLHPVHPHEVEVITDEADPERPVMIRWWRLREVRPGTYAWTADVYDIREGRERYAVEDEHGHDVSPEHLSGVEDGRAPSGGYRGDAYPYRAGGEAILPWVMYHAARTGSVWDWGASCEIVDATLSIGTLWTYWRHLVQTASWPQRYLINGIVAGQSTVGEGEDARRVVVADPAVLLRILQDEGSDSGPRIEQDSTNADPHTLGQAIAAYERRAIALAGLNPADFVRSSGDPRSGYAMAITRDGQREAQRRYEHVFRTADQNLCRMVAALWGGLPSEGYRIAYEAIPPTVDELLSMQEYVDREVAAGRMTDVQAYQMLHPEISTEDAVRQIAAIRSIRDADQEATNARRAEPDRARDRDGDDEPEPDAELVE